MGSAPSNDETNIITFQSIRRRLGLAAEFDVEGLIRTRGDLFRPGATSAQLSAWKEELREGKRLPSWIRSAAEGAERTTLIESLSAEQCFRSQFRREKNAPRSPIEITEWGLKHLDRLRETRTKSNEERDRKWTAFWIPLFSSAIALVAVLGGMYQGSAALRAQADLKRFELEFSPKQQAYARMMQDHLLLYQAAPAQNDSALKSIGNDLTAAYFQLEPFLSDVDRKRVESSYRDFLYLAYTLPPGAAFRRDTFPFKADSSIHRLRALLYPALFRSHSEPAKQ